jgi:hypothetical protein
MTIWGISTGKPVKHGASFLVGPSSEYQRYTCLTASTNKVNEMPSMNIAMQRRIGKLPKTSENAMAVRNGYFGYSHRGWGGNKPTAQYEGFFGIGTGWYGNDDMAQGDLPVNGFYGATDQEDPALDAYLNGHYLQLGEGESASADSAVKGMMENQITTSEGFVLTQQSLMVAAGLGVSNV